MLRRLFAAASLLIAASGPAEAATVNFILDLTGPDGTFNVYATTSEGDNVGLSLYGVELSGPGIDLAHLSTATMDAESTAAVAGSAGFTFFRAVDDFGDGRVRIRASQDIFGGPAHMLYGLGQNSGSLGANGLAATGTVTSPTWDAEYLLAAGTYAAGAGAIDIALDGVTCANVFTQPGLTFNDIASITKEIRRRDPFTGAIVSTGPISLPPSPAYEPPTPAPAAPSEPSVPEPAAPEPPALVPQEPVVLEPPLVPEPPAPPVEVLPPSLIDVFEPVLTFDPEWHWSIETWRASERIVQFHSLLSAIDVVYDAGLSPSLDFDGESIGAESDELTNGSFLVSSRAGSLVRTMGAAFDVGANTPQIPEPATTPMAIVALGALRRRRAARQFSPA